MGALSRTLNYLKRNGFSAAWSAVCEELEKRRALRDHPYCYDAPAGPLLKAQRLMAGDLYAGIMKDGQKDVRKGDSGQENSGPGPKEGAAAHPLFSVITPCYHTPPLFFRQLLDSLAAQTFPYWELILADAGEEGLLKHQLEEWLKENESKPEEVDHKSRGDITPVSFRRRIRYIQLAENQGISENTNVGMNAARGDYLALLDHDDLLTPDALYEMARGILIGKKQNKEYRMLFSDEDKCTTDGKMFYIPHRKEKYNLDLLLSNNYICHFLVFKREKELQLLRKEFDGAQDYDLILRLSRSINKQEILHIPRVLYHWRISENSSAENPKVKSYAYEAGRAVLKEYMQSNGIEFNKIVSLPHLGFYRIDYNEDLFSAREDVAAVGGPVWRRGRICDGLRVDGQPLFLGLKKGFSGPMHRAALQQDAFSLHPGNVQLRPELQTEWNAFRGNAMRKGLSEEESFDEFCAILRRRGYRLLYDPLFRCEGQESNG